MRATATARRAESNTNKTIAFGSRSITSATATDAREQDIRPQRVHLAIREARVPLQPSIGAVSS
jgi:hypothetical protein